MPLSWKPLLLSLPVAMVTLVPVASANQIGSQSSHLAQNVTQVYPRDIIDNFMGACDPNGSNRAFCVCTINKIQEQYSLEEFIQIDSAIANGGQTPETIVKIAVDCQLAILNPTPSQPNPTVTPASRPAIPPSPTVQATPEPPPRPRLSASQTEALNDQLRQAIDAQDWDRAVDLLDQMIDLYPQQAGKLRTYRARIDALRLP